MTSRALHRVSHDWALYNAVLSACASALNVAGTRAASTGSGTTDFGFKEVNKDEKDTLVGQVFTRVAPKYDLMNDVMSGGMHRLWKDKFVNMLDPSPGIDHLDVAGGTGDIAFRILRRLRQGESYEGSVTVLDINSEMIEQGQKRAEQLKLAGPHLKWIVDSAENLPLHASCMDSYTISFGIWNVTNRDKALTEALRVLKPGGRFMCMEFTPMDTPIIKDVYEAYSMNVVPMMGQAIANDADSYRYLVESIRKFPDKIAFAEMIQDAGFRGVDYETLAAGGVAIHWGFKL